MVVRIALFFVAIAVAHFLSGCAIENSASPSVTAFSPSDERVKHTLTEKQKGVVLVDTIVTDSGSNACLITSLLTDYTSPDGTRNGAPVRGREILFGKITGGIVNYLNPGEYTISAIKCDSINKTVFLNGPHAKFTVVAGELIDAGTLKIDFQVNFHISQVLLSGLVPKEGIGRRSVEESNPEVMEMLRREMPQSIHLIKRRPMILVGASEYRIKEATPVSRLMR